MEGLRRPPIEAAPHDSFHLPDRTTLAIPADTALAQEAGKNADRAGVTMTTEFTHTPHYACGPMMSARPCHCGLYHIAQHLRL
jgi:hypothetical protein